MSANERGYNPIDYQVGSIWPHDNALIGVGFKRYGFAEDAARIFSALCEAAVHVQLSRLPEVFAGYDRQNYTAPVRYPLACNPRAWAAGALPCLLWALLGIEPDAASRTLRIVRPHLPEWVPWLEISSLRLGSAMVDLRWQQSGDYPAVTVLKHTGDIQVIVE